MLAARRDAVFERARGQSVVLAVQDTTPLNFSTHRHTRGLGPISNNADKTIGLLLHSTLLLREDGQPLGVLDALVLARDPAQFKAGADGSRNRRPAGEKESRKWLQSAAAGAHAAGELAGASVINIGDREGDSCELFLHHREERAHSGGRHELLIRCQHDRQPTHDHDGLFSRLGKQPAAAHWSVEIPRKPGNKARTATLAIHRSAAVPDAPPCTRQAVRWIARLGGFLGRKHDGEPGMITPRRGLHRLHDIATTRHFLTAARALVGDD